MIVSFVWEPVPAPSPAPAPVPTQSLLLYFVLSVISHAVLPCDVAAVVALLVVGGVAAPTLSSTLDGFASAEITTPTPGLSLFWLGFLPRLGLINYKDLR